MAGSPAAPPRHPRRVGRPPPRQPLRRSTAVAAAATAAAVVVAAATSAAPAVALGGRSRPLPALAPHARVCWTAAATPCGHTLTEAGAAGCAECAAPAYAAPVDEYATDAGIDAFLGVPDGPRRVLLLPWALASRRTFAALAAARRRVAAVLLVGVDPAGGVPRDVPPGVVSPAAGRPNDAYVAAPGEGPRWNVNGNGVDELSLPFNVWVLPPDIVTEVRRRSARYLSAASRPSPSPAETTPAAATPAPGGVPAPAASPTRPPPAPSASATPPGGRLTPETRFPRFVVETAGMSAACGQATSAECLGNGTCTPVGGHTVWAVAGGRLEPDRASAAIPGAADGDYVAVAAPRDSRALVQGTGVGATAEATAAVTVLAVAAAFGEWHRAHLAGAGAGRRLPRLPVYFLWDAEAAGFAGSRRFVRDVATFVCRDEADEKALAADARGALGCAVPPAWSRAFEAFRLPPGAGGGPLPAEPGAPPEGQPPSPPSPPPRSRITHVLDVGTVGTAQRRAGRRGGSPRAGVVAAADFVNTPLYVHAGPAAEVLRQALLVAFDAETVRPWPAAAAPPPAPGGGGGAPVPPAGGGTELPLAAAANRSWPLFPPTSGQSWAAWAAATADADLPDGRRLDGPVVVALTDYDAALRSTVYHSQLDVLPADPRAVVEQVALAARGLVRALVALALADDPPAAPTPGATAAAAPANASTLRHVVAATTAAAAAAAAAAVDEATIEQLLRCWALPWAAGRCGLAGELLGAAAAAALAPAVGATNWAAAHAAVDAAAAAAPSRAAKTRLARAFLARATARRPGSGGGGGGGAAAAARRCPTGDDAACAADGGVCVGGGCVAPAAVHLHEAYGAGIEPVRPPAAAAAAGAAAAAAAAAAYTVADAAAGAAAWAVAPTGGLTVCGAAEDGRSLHVAVLTVGVGVLLSSLAVAAGVRYGLMVAAMAERQARWRRARVGRRSAWAPAAAVPD